VRTHLCGQKCVCTLCGYLNASHVQMSIKTQLTVTYVSVPGFVFVSRLFGSTIGQSAGSLSRAPKLSVKLQKNPVHISQRGPRNVPMSRILVSQMISQLPHSATVQGPESYFCQPERSHRLGIAEKNIDNKEISPLVLLSTILRGGGHSYQEAPQVERLPWRFNLIKHR